MARGKELYAGTPNSDIRKLCTLLCGRNVNKPSNKLIYQVRANTYDFWLSGQFGKYNSKIFLFHPFAPFPSKLMRCPWILCFDLLLLQFTDLTNQIWQFLVYIFLGSRYAWTKFSRLIEWTHWDFKPCLFSLNLRINTKMSYKSLIIIKISLNSFIFD